MYCTYIIFSQKLNKYYIGHTEDVKLRLERHDAGWGKFTSNATNWELKYHEEYGSKAEAAKRELEIKRKKSRKYIE